MSTRSPWLLAQNKLLIGATAIALSLTGCATTDGRMEQYAAKMNGMVGHATYEEQVRKRGTPESKESFPDGTFVAVWKRNHFISNPAYTSVTSFSPYQADAVTVGGGTMVIPEITSLTFNKNGVLIEWHNSMYRPPKKSVSGQK